MSQQFLVAAEGFKKILLNQIPVIDVRAPIEFIQGHIPGSINRPILSDEHRHEIGTVFKKKGQEAALYRGHELVSGEYKEAMIQGWKTLIDEKPDAIITCFRGGQRSQIAQSWLSERGLVRPRIDGGYKAFRQFILDQLIRLSSQPMLIISGATGSGKTLLIDRIKHDLPAIDLEGLANHRGSAFGHRTAPQPSQVDYENTLVQKLLQIESKAHHLPLIVEDESRMIGRTAQPEIFFNQLRSSEIILLEESLASRVQVIYDEYVLNNSQEEQTKAFARYEISMQMISKKLGGLRFDELKTNLKEAILASTNHGDHTLHKLWIEIVSVVLRSALLGFP